MNTNIEASFHALEISEEVLNLRVRHEFSFKNQDDELLKSHFNESELHFVPGMAGHAVQSAGERTAVP